MKFNIHNIAYKETESFSSEMRYCISAILIPTMEVIKVIIYHDLAYHSSIQHGLT